MAKKKSIDIGSLTANAQAVIVKQVKEAADAKEEADAKEYKGEVEFYYAVKEALEKKLAADLSGALDKANFSIAKKLKIIAALPPKKPTTAKGYIKAHKGIATGKVGARKRASKAEDEAIIVEVTKGEVKARKLTPRKKKVTSKKKATAKKA